MVRGIRVACVVAVALGGCVDSQPALYFPIVTPPRPMPPRPVEQVDIFVATPPSRPHVDVGMLQTLKYYSGPDDPSALQEMIGRLRTGAAAHGCDAIVVTMVDARRNQHMSSSVQASCELYTDTRVVATIGEAGADIRTAPRSEAPVITRLNAGTRVVVFSWSAGWSFVKLSDGGIGYINDVVFARRL